jgi:hypothetical protein
MLTGVTGTPATLQTTVHAIPVLEAERKPSPLHHVEMRDDRLHLFADSDAGRDVPAPPRIGPENVALLAA